MIEVQKAQVISGSFLNGGYSPQRSIEVEILHKVSGKTKKVSLKQAELAIIVHLLKLVSLLFSLLRKFSDFIFLIYNSELVKEI